MNKRIFLITALIILIMSVSAVSAENINQTEDTLEISASDVISDNAPKSFSDLEKAFEENSDDGINIVSDYEFNSAADDDYKEGITLNLNPEGTYTINGNNHVIDAKNQAGIFKLNKGTFIINNLKLCNANTSSIILNDCELRTNNVSFENNNDPGEGAAIYASQSDYYSSNDKFINNHAQKGASIFAYKSIVNINNSRFASDNIYWGMIYAYDSVTTVNNTVFENMTSKYATAIYAEEYDVKSKLTVLNSKFINLKANATAGAIGSKKTDSVIIDGCSFINVTSAKNAGAVYADVNGVTTNVNKTVTISNSIFENCSSNFGGAYLQLGGKLNIAKTNFVNNIAQYMGGAVYLSNATFLISGSKFNKNNASYNYGGALYIDDGNCIISSNEFSNNFAGTAGDAIYLHDSQYNIKNCEFSNNDEAIVSFFDRQDSSLSNNVLNGGKTLLNQSSYNTIVSYEGKEISLIPNPVTNATAKDSSFDLRNYVVNGYSLSGTVKNQGNNGACWAFGATGALESAFLKATGILLDISENNIQGAATRYSEFGTESNNEGGFAISGMSLFLSWLSVFSTEFDTYDELGKISIAAFVPGDSYHIQDAIIIPPRKSALDNDKLKDALVKYGGLTVHVYGASANNNYYNPSTSSQYYNGDGYGNHFVTLVGWDDSYSKDNFKITPPGDGAWICKNSWGTNWGENGYFYVSYYDKTLAMTSESVGYIISNTESYSTVYQYDIGCIEYYNDKGQTITFINTYDAIDNELISAVGSYFVNAGDEYAVKIFVDDAEVYSQNGVASHGGFETIKLNKKIAVNAGHKFSVQIQAKNIPYLYDTRIHIENGKSMAYYNYTDGSVEDLGKIKRAAAIKAYTIKNDNPKESNSQYYNKNSNITISSNDNGKIINILTKEGKTLGSATVEEGKAAFNFTLEPGSFAISYDDSDTLEAFEIMNSIDVIDSVKIAYKAPLTIEAAFYDEDGIELFGSDINLILDGKNYMETIMDIDGMLYLNLYDLSIGKHTLILKNPKTGEESLTTINVVSRFSGNSNVNMYYADGSSFKVRAYNNNGNPVGANQIVTIKLNKKTYKVKTNSNGYAILKIPNTVKSGTYTLTASYAGQTIKNTVKVKKVLKLAKVKVKKSAKKLVIKATLKGKSPIKNKKLSFIFNGKKYTAKTNKNGIAKITIKKSVLKKLKVGKKLIYKVTYLKTTVKQSVKVKK